MKPFGIFSFTDIHLFRDLIFFLFKRFTFISSYVYMCKSVCGYVHIHAGARGGQESISRAGVTGSF